MQSNELLTATNLRADKKPPPIASLNHLIGFLLIGVGLVVLGLLAQHAPTSGGAGTSTGQLGRHNQAIPIYLVAILTDWALLYYCWAGVHRRGGNLKTLSGGRWTSWRSLVVDVAIALPFWVLWEATAYGVHRLLGPTTAKSLDSLLPKSLPEILIWIGTSITAGICEEMAFRGYLQRQFHALTGSVLMAVLAQGAVFGLFHFYQGWKNVIVIALLGVLYGAL
jgi:membrane protease YdiL (CAAX protease family)